MDILNWIYLKREQLIRTKANNPDTDLVALGANVGFNKRDDLYQTYAMPLKDLIQAGNEANVAYYTLDLSVSSVVDVTTPRGIIEISLDTQNSSPLPLCESAVVFTITNSNVDFTDPDNIYMQHSVYYNPGFNDQFVPHVVSTGFIAGANYAVFNTNLRRQTSINGYTYSGGGTVIGAADTTYSFLSGSTTGAGQGARWAVTRDSGGSISEVYLITPGEDYAPTDTITIPGNLIGGTSPIDDLTITVNTIWGENQFAGRLYVYYELYSIS